MISSDRVVGRKYRGRLLCIEHFVGWIHRMEECRKGLLGDHSRFLFGDLKGAVAIVIMLCCVLYECVLGFES